MKPNGPQIGSRGCQNELQRGHGAPKMTPSGSSETLLGSRAQTETTKTTLESAKGRQEGPRDVFRADLGCLKGSQTRAKSGPKTELI